MTAVWWEGPYFHPKEFQEGEITSDLVDDLRMARPDMLTPKCNAAAALASSSEVLPSIRRCACLNHMARMAQAVVRAACHAPTQHILCM